MIELTLINILKKPDGILNLKNRFDKIIKNIPALYEDLLSIAWKCMKIVLII